MLRRCNNPKDTGFKHYGGRGIKVCAEWEKDYTSFEKWALSSGYDDQLSIDRIDNNKGYSPDNCRWADRKTQMNNTSVNRRYTYNGESHTIKEWSEITGVNESMLRSRLNRAWTIEDALTTPSSGTPARREGWLSIKEIAERFSLTYDKARRYFNQFVLSTYQYKRVGGVKKVPEEQFTEFLKRGSNEKS
jgi:hypothetical protein